MINRVLLTAIGAAVTTSASATLQVYEPFNYTSNAILTGQGGALGTTGTWNTADIGIGENGGKTNDWYVHAEGSTSGVGLSFANPSADPGGLHQWDGKVDNLSTSGGYVGLWGADDWADPDGPNTGEPGRNLSADIGLDPSVTASFQTGTTTWISYVSVRGWDRNEEAPNLVLGTDPAPDGGRGDIYPGSGFGAGGGPTQINRTDIYPMHYDNSTYTNVNGQITGTGGTAYNGAANTPLTVSAADSFDWEELDPATNLFGTPNIVVMKIEWNADTGGEDILTVVRFLENETISEAAFDAYVTTKPNLSTENWTANKPNIDETQLDTLTFMGLKFFVDEVRLADAFADALPGGVTIAPGDTDGDGDIDDSDLGTSFANYTGPVGAAGGKTAAQGDTDGDGDVDDSDLGTSFAGYTGPLGPAEVPEPTSLALLGLGGLLIARRRRA